MTRSMILAVDDDPVNLHIIREVFKREHVTITFADSGENALRMLVDPACSFDVVLLDRMMDGMDGIEVLRRMKSEPRLRHTPVVMQTAAAAPDQVCEGLTAGAHYYLTKPYAPSTLRTIVKAALEHARDRRELEARATHFSEAMVLLDSAQFVVRTHVEAQRVAALVSQVCPEPRSAVLGLAELMINGIEHGNLGISCVEKAALLREDGLAEEIARRQQLPEHALRRVHLCFERDADKLQFEVRDEGAGFDYTKYLELDPERAFEPNGRGIALARMMSFHALEYRGRGNVVLATIHARPPQPA